MFSGLLSYTHFASLKMLDAQICAFGNEVL